MESCSKKGGFERIDKVMPNDRQRRFVQNRKKEGKKRKSCWCTDLEWKVISYIRQHIQLEEIKGEDMVVGGQFIIYEDNEYVIEINLRKFTM